MSNNNTQSGGIGFFGLLTVAFIVLKLMNVINWSWWLVLLPFYGPLIIVLIVIFVLFMIIKR